jgi:demethylmenaquinone methyltransferase/2-methoxy-6-polyprenyl-1,4-benzoquinol methylase
MEEEDLLREQINYYRARADEYDEWFFRQGRYDRGAEHRAEWLAEIDLVGAALQAALPRGRMLELACGTGLWTRRLAEQHQWVVAVDASPEAIALNRDRVKSSNVEYLLADLFEWVPPTSSFDAVFFGFWLSHVPPSKFEAFWAMVRAALKPRGVVFFVDSLFEQDATARDHVEIDRSGVVRRRLNDGREFNVVKIFREPAVLESTLREDGWKGSVRSAGRFFLYGSMVSAPQSVSE